MARRLRRDDGKTIDLEKEEAQQADITNKARRVILAGKQVTGVDSTNIRVEDLTAGEFLYEILQQIKITNEHLAIITENFELEED